MTWMGGIAMTAKQNGPDGVQASNLFVSIGLPEGMAAAFAGARKVITLELEEISAERIAPIQTAFVACLLVSPKLDAVTVISALQAAGFLGQLAVISPRLPNVSMVERELRAAAPNMRVNLIPL
jgi:hypothetical protein